jgi:DNA polymerase-3 subunit epsilon
MYLFFDTETTGANKAKDRTVQLAWLLVNEAGGEIEKKCFIIKPSGFRIPSAAAAIHGISTEQAYAEGEELEYVLTEFLEALNEAQVIVAHNIDFDVAILRNDLAELGIEDPFSDKDRICTMRSSTAWCRISHFNGRSGFKWPKLEELHYRLFGEYIDGAHDALVDVEATKRCFFELIDIGVIEGISLEEPRKRVAKNDREERKESIRNFISITKYYDGFIPKYKTGILRDTSGGTVSTAQHVAHGEHLTSCPKCGAQKILRNGCDDYPAGVIISCGACVSSHHISEVAYLTNFERSDRNFKVGSPVVVLEPKVDESIKNSRNLYDKKALIAETPNEEVHEKNQDLSKKSISITKYHHTFIPKYKTPMLRDNSGGSVSTAQHVDDGEHLASCPKCGVQKILRNGCDDYPAGLQLSCGACGNSYRISELFYSAPVERSNIGGGKNVGIEAEDTSISPKSWDTDKKPIVDTQSQESIATVSRDVASNIYSHKSSKNDEGKWLVIVVTIFAIMLLLSLA